MPYPKRSEQIPRILQLAVRLFRLRPITLAEAAEEFGVSERTVRRDLKTIGRFVPLRQDADGWRLDPWAKEADPLDAALLQAFAESARIRAACLDRHTLDRRNVELAVRYHRLPKEMGETLLQAIRTDRLCRFDYRNKEGDATRRIAAPVKLLSSFGIWYLVSLDAEKNEPRTFRLDRMKNVTILKKPRNLSAKKQAELESVRDPWSAPGTTPKPIRIYADAYALGYLTDTPLHPSQSLEEAHADGGAVFLYRITHPMELMPKIKSWIPHLKILEPNEWKESLEKELRDYLNDT